MQEELERKTVAIILNGGKLTARLLAKALAAVGRKIVGVKHRTRYGSHPFD